MHVEFETGIIILFVSEVGKCIISTGTIDNDMSIHSGSSSVLETSNVRSLLQCVDHCMNHRLCHGSLYVANERERYDGKRQPLFSTVPL